MVATVGGRATDRLERLCSHRPERISLGADAPGLERAEYFLSGPAFDQHRHDTYAIGINTAGVGAFRYRGARRVCLPGQVHILLPDEPHDGSPATEDVLSYRILYLAPELVHEALGGGALPFVSDPVQPLRTATQPIAAALADLREPISDLARAEIAAALADMLVALESRPRPTGEPVDRRTVALVRDYLTAHAREQTPAATLEQLTGTDRFTIARHFRRAFGTSPDRYRTLRRVELARAAIKNGHPLARAAAEAGFADQSHMTRQFKNAYGFTPGRWAALTRATRDHPPTPGEPHD
jgi:AraC-like DNA-binding protein